MSSNVYSCVAFSVVKHDYLAKAVQAHPSFEIVVVADNADVPDWVHQRNKQFAIELGISYIPDLNKALKEFDIQVAVVSSEAERHCELSVQALQAGLHVVQDKPMSTKITECERVVTAVKESGKKFMLWSRNFLPSLVQAQREIKDGTIGVLKAIHVDFYFSKDAGPPIGSRSTDDPPINWLERQLEAHSDGSDGGVGVEPMGELQIEGVYPLSYIHMLTQKRVHRVFARTTAHFHQANADNKVDDLATVTLEMDDDVLGTLSIGRIGAASHPDIGEIKLHIIGSMGALVISEARPEVSVYHRAQPDLEFRKIRGNDSNNFLLMENFKTAIEQDMDTVLDATAGRDIAKVVASAIESGKTGQVVVIK